MILISTNTYFNPPTPCGVGPSAPPYFVWTLFISIHPPRVGWDFTNHFFKIAIKNFNPPTPCGVGPVAHCLAARGV